MNQQNRQKLTQSNKPDQQQLAQLNVGQMNRAKQQTNENIEAATETASKKDENTATKDKKPAAKTGVEKTWNTGMSEAQIAGANIGILLSIIIPVFLIIWLICWQIEKGYNLANEDEKKGYMPMVQE